MRTGMRGDRKTAGYFSRDRRVARHPMFQVPGDRDGAQLPRRHGHVASRPRARKPAQGAFRPQRHGETPQATRMRTCDDIRERLTLYLDNELQDDERLRVATHVQSCASCSGLVDKELAFLNGIRSSAPLYTASADLKTTIAELTAGPEIGRA